MIDTLAGVSGDPVHWAISLVLVGIWLLICWLCLRKPAEQSIDKAECLVVFASQTGHAEDIARATHARIAAGGRPVQLLEADCLTPELLDAARKIFFILSTTGDGDAPDNARAFEQRVLSADADLSGKRVLLLGLGDRRYSDFCGFALRVWNWAERCGAQLRVPLVPVDDLAPADLARWDQHLGEEGYPPVPAAEDRGQSWQVIERKQVADAAFGPEGEQTSDGLYRLAIKPEAGGRPEWDIGDLFELETPDGHFRDYSIANLPGADELLLFVRRVVEGGVAGRGSGLLTSIEPAASNQAASNHAGSNFTGRIRQHRSFRPPAGQGSLLAVGAGSGWAGLRPHIAQAIAQGRRCWLVFGEREAGQAEQLFAEMREWHEDGRLQRLDLVLSRGGGPYVQTLLEDKAREVADFLDGEGCVVLCGRLAMGEASLAVLRASLGAEWLEQAQADGRLRHDFY
ncbi:NADPH cytochrome P450 oxidoreductase family protein [Alteraurantiacibacter aquimixticola]|nr:NADPH cytochrome P450 oxidoreductase family protein [Alteraurantiacibacter aquimixticola]